MNNSFAENPKMPVLFVGHGNPMNAISENIFTKGWAELIKNIPQPKAILCVSAHWETNGTKVTAMPQPKTIHDFYGFPKALFDVQYPAKGNPELAQNMQKEIGSQLILDHDEWGLDHGAWSVLAKMYPKADIPVLQLSLNTNWNFKQHYEFAKQLEFLRRNGVLIIGSGNIVHNLRQVRMDGKTHDWAFEFDERTRKAISENNHDVLINYKMAGKAGELAVNSGEHYLPLLYIMALKGSNETVTFTNTQPDLGAITMTCVRIN